MKKTFLDTFQPTFDLDQVPDHAHIIKEEDENLKPSPIIANKNMHFKYKLRQPELPTSHFNTLKAEEPPAQTQLPPRDRSGTRVIHQNKYLNIK